MLNLEPANRIIADLVREKFIKPTSLDQAFYDFDSVRYHLSTPHRKTQLLLSMDIPCWDQLVQYGARRVLEREYGQRLAPEGEEEEGYRVSLWVDLEDPSLVQSQAGVGGDSGDEDPLSAFITSLSLLKRNALAAPFERAFERQRELEQLQASAVGAGEEMEEKEEVMAVDYRPEEAIYLLPSRDRVTIIFSTIFKEETDRIFGRVFLQEFVDARRRPSCQTAPQVLYSHREAPLEIRHLEGLAKGENVGYVTFVLFPRHLAPAVAASTITQIQLFRDYLHYHIKCSKAYMHSRMRVRVVDFLKVLNRAKPDKESGASGSGSGSKTASGRSFVRA